MFFQKGFVPTAIFLVCLLILGHGLVPAAADKNKVPEISVDRLKQMLGLPGTVIIDVRRYRDWWRSGKVDKWAHKYAKDRTLIFYCS
jgi:hypothetical protein